ncbi:MAG: hypothetical protein QF909_11610 [SAR202 cluster bacterium]|jgi:ABC-2 type transport system permease protein|nr:hypothetical protein [SAR202 cluster bacterium]MDP7413682.1 hypothetical protein [SAR202 cluster bacterium]
MTESDGQLFDLGYQHYEGPREGRMRARKALFVNGVRTSLGLGRSTTAKLLPFAFFAAIMAPAILLALGASTIGDTLTPGAELPGHADYYQIVSLLILIFSAIIAPELLCSDRRNRVLSLYMVRPLTSTDYVAGRWVAFFAITILLVYAGQIVLLLGLALGADEPLTYLKDNWLDIPRFLAAGAIVALLTTTIPLAVAGFTSRRAIASVFVIGLFVVTISVANILVECKEHDVTIVNGQVVEERCEPLTGSAAKWLGLIDIGSAPIHLSDMIFDKEADEQLGIEVAKLNNVYPVLWYLLWILGPGLVLLARYRRMSP